jgi:hypothetical protein
MDHLRRYSRRKKETSKADNHVCVFISAVPIIKPFVWGEGDSVEDMCYERRRAEACVD